MEKKYIDIIKEHKLYYFIRLKNLEITIFYKCLEVLKNMEAKYNAIDKTWKILKEKYNNFEKIIYSLIEEKKNIAEKPDITEIIQDVIEYINNKIINYNYNENEQMQISNTLIQLFKKTSIELHRKIYNKG